MIGTLVPQLGLARHEIYDQFTKRARRVMMVGPINHRAWPLLCVQADATSSQAMVVDAESLLHQNRRMVTSARGGAWVMARRPGGRRPCVVRAVHAEIPGFHLAAPAR